MHKICMKIKQFSIANHVRNQWVSIVLHTCVAYIYIDAFLNSQIIPDAHMFDEYDSTFILITSLIFIFQGQYLAAPE